MLLVLIGIGFNFFCKVDSNHFLATDRSAGLNVGIRSTIKNVSILNMMCIHSKKICLIKAACRSSEVSIINTDVEVKTLSVIGYALMTTSIISHR